MQLLTKTVKVLPHVGAFKGIETGRGLGGTGVEDRDVRKDDGDGLFGHWNGEGKKLGRFIAQ